MKVFVTGGSGYLGRNLINALIERGDVVQALARSDEAASTVTRLGAMGVRGDLADRDALREGMAACDYVVHSAADTSTTPSEQQRQANVDGTINVLEAARAAGVRRVVHVSTEAVLADGKPLTNVDERSRLTLKPASVMAAASRLMNL